MNPLQLMQLKGIWDKFRKEHPKFPMFMNAVAQNAIMEGSIMEIEVKTPDGKSYTTNLKLTADDIQSIEKLKELAQKNAK